MKRFLIFGRKAILMDLAYAPNEMLGYQQLAKERNSLIQMALGGL